MDKPAQVPSLAFPLTDPLQLGLPYPTQQWFFYKSGHKVVGQSWKIRGQIAGSMMQAQGNGALPIHSWGGWWKVSDCFHQPCVYLQPHWSQHVSQILDFLVDELALA